MNWNPDDTDRSIDEIPVSVLSGFLGAGKTTLLNHILVASSSRRYAVLVNDLGEVNIDAALIKSEIKEMEGAIGGMLELQGGCICCTIQTDLLDALLELSQKFKPEHILIEATGVAEPRSIVETIYSVNPFGKSGTDFLKIANLLTVVDGGNLEQYFESDENTGVSKRKHLLNNDPRRPLQELLMEQVECADILLINKSDTLSEDNRRRFNSYLKSLNDHAEIWETSFGAVDVERLMQHERFCVDRTLIGARWRQEMFENLDAQNDSSECSGHSHQEHSYHDHGHDHGRHQAHDHDHSCDQHSCGHDHSHDDHAHHDHKDYGLETYVFNARRQFVESKLLKVFRTGLVGVIRAKGFYWTERVPERVGLLSLAGKILRADYMTDWFYGMVRNGEISYEELPELVRSAWLPDYGDRRQEIVFIGIDLDREGIERALTECFVPAEIVS